MNYELGWSLRARCGGKWGGGEVGKWGDGVVTACALRGEVGWWGSGGISTKTLKP
jgi:hypothetical protein